MFGRDVAQCSPERLDSFAGQRVVDPSAVAARAEQPRAGHGPNVMGSVGHALADLVGDLVHGTFSLSEKVDDLRAPSARQRLGHLRESVEQRVLGGSFTHGGIFEPLGPIVKSSNEYLTRV
jgi:hypothetical protein